MTHILPVDGTNFSSFFASASLADLLYVFFGSYNPASRSLHEIYLQEHGVHVDSRFGVRFGEMGFCNSHNSLYLLLHADTFDGVSYCARTSGVYPPVLFYSATVTSEVPLLYDNQLPVLTGLFEQCGVASSQARPLLEHYISWLKQLPSWQRPRHIVFVDS